MKAHKWIRKFHKRTHISQQKFSKLIGIDCGNYSKYENGRLCAGDDFIDRFSETCKLSDVEVELIRALSSHDKLLCFVIREDEK